MPTTTVENYLKAIYTICQNNDGVASTNQISELINNTPSSVSNMLKKLASSKHIEYKKYYGVRLTEKGKQTATQLIRKHRIWETFLVQSLGYGWSEVHHIAEQLEHIEADGLIDRLDDYLGNPKFDPHGDPIPNSDGDFERYDLISLADVEVNKDYSIGRVIDDDNEFLQFLDRMEIRIGTNVKAVQRFSFDESLQVVLDNGNTILLNQSIAKRLFVIES